MFSKWQRKYEEEAERLVEVLRRWYALESEAKRLEWELARCQNPEASDASAPAEARKPALLRRAEAGKSVVPDTKRGLEQSWKNRHKEVSTFREHYENNTSRLEIRVKRLAKKLAECRALRGKGIGDAERRAASAVETGSTKQDAYKRMPPALRRMRAQLEKVRQAQQSASSPELALDVAVQTLEEKPVAQENPFAQEKSIEQEKPVAQENPFAQEKPIEQEKPVAQETPAEQETPEKAPALPPPQETQRSEAVPLLESTYQALKQDHEALERAMEEIKGQLKLVTARLQTREKELRASREAAETLTQKQTAERQALEALPVLIKHFRHGQRSFLAQPDAPDVGPELAGLIYYALTHLALALTSGEKARARAMYANLHTIARNLQSYKLTTLHGFDAALEVLRTMPGGDAAHYAAQLRRSPQTPGSEARPIGACLKAMRDKASVELRPFFYDLDQEGEVITIG